MTIERFVCLQFCRAMRVRTERGLLRFPQQTETDFHLLQPQEMVVPLGVPRTSTRGTPPMASLWAMHHRLPPIRIRVIQRITKKLPMAISRQLPTAPTNRMETSKAAVARTTEHVIGNVRETGNEKESAKGNVRVGEIRTMEAFRRETDSRLLYRQLKDTPTPTKENETGTTVPAGDPENVQAGPLSGAHLPTTEAAISVRL